MKVTCTPEIPWLRQTISTGNPFVEVVVVTVPTKPSPVPIWAPAGSGCRDACETSAFETEVEHFAWAAGRDVDTRLADIQSTPGTRLQAFAEIAIPWPYSFGSLYVW